MSNAPSPTYALSTSRVIEDCPFWMRGHCGKGGDCELNHRPPSSNGLILREPTLSVAGPSLLTNINNPLKADIAQQCYIGADDLVRERLSWVLDRVEQLNDDHQNAGGSAHLPLLFSLRPEAINQAPASTWRTLPVVPTVAGNRFGDNNPEPVNNNRRLLYT